MLFLLQQRTYFRLNKIDCFSFKGMRQLAMQMDSIVVLNIQSPALFEWSCPLGNLPDISQRSVKHDTRRQFSDKGSRDHVCNEKNTGRHLVKPRVGVFINAKHGFNIKQWR